MPNLCLYFLTSHSDLSTASVVCRFDSAPVGCNKYFIRTRWRPLLSNASVDLGFADPMYATTWNDHSRQSLCTPVNVGAVPKVLVSTSGVDFGTTASCCCVSSSTLRLYQTRHQRFHISSSKLRTSLKLKCCLVINSTPRAPLPRLSIWLFIHCSGPIVCFPGYQVPIQSHFPTSHVSRMLRSVPRMNRVSTRDQSACTTHREQSSN